MYLFMGSDTLVVLTQELLLKPLHLGNPSQHQAQHKVVTEGLSDVVELVAVALAVATDDTHYAALVNDQRHFAKVHRELKANL